MKVISKIFKIIGLTLLAVTLGLFGLELLIPGMEGVHWFGIYTFMPGLALWAIGSLLVDKKPVTPLDVNLPKSFSLIQKLLWGTVLLLIVLLLLVTIF